MAAYYNENDPKAAAWLRELIRRDLIAPGDVDERSIEDVHPDDLHGYVQCHFFAGIGVWAYALRRAGWVDDRPVWTGSCPCQPYSTAGKGAGFADERHLWPAWHHLIRVRNPPVLFGEQVASKAADQWTDLVQDDLEALGYAFGAVPFPAASVGAPHIRDRNYWMAYDHECARRQGRAFPRRRHQGSDAQPRAGSGGGGVALDGVADSDALQDSAERDPRRAHAGGCGEPCNVADSGGAGLEVIGEQQARGQCPATERSGEACELGDTGLPQEERQRPHGGEVLPVDESERSGVSGSASELGDPSSEQFRAQGRGCDAGPAGTLPDSIEQRQRVRPEPGSDGRTSFWSNVEWIPCRDGKWRPVEPGTFPLAHGAPERVGRLRGYGNAIVAQAAQVWIETCREALEG